MPTKNIMVRAGADFSAITRQAAKAKTSMSGMRASINSACSGMTTAVGKLNKVMGLLGVGLSAAAVLSFAKSAKSAYETQIEGETKLATIMRQRMAASDGDIKGIVEMTSAQQKLGVVGDEVQLAGAQQLATFMNQTSSLKTLIPVMNNLIVQQNGYSATTEAATKIGNLMGKAMQGQVTALRRCGITFTDAEAAAMKYGNEQQRAAMLAQIITNNVGQMNTAMAATPSGRLQQVSNALGDIKEQFGAAVTTSLTAFLPALNGICSVLAAMATLANKVAQSLANVFGGTAKSAGAVVTYGGAASGAMDDVADSTNSAGGAAKKLKNLSSFGFDTLQKLSNTSSSSGSGSGGGAGVSESSGIADTGKAALGAGEGIGWLEKVLQRLKQTADSLDFTNLNNSLDRLKTSLGAFNANLGKGLRWLYDNVLEPLAKWTISQLLPAFLNVLSGAISVVNSVIQVAMPGLKWLWDSFLQPIAKWTGGAIVTILNGIADALTKISGWIDANPELAATLGAMAGALLVAGNAGKIFMGIGMSIGGVIMGLTTSFAGISAAIGFLTSPIGLVILAIGALVAAIVICINFFKETGTTAAGVWQGIVDAWNQAGAYFAGVWARVQEGAAAVWGRVKGNALEAWTAISKTASDGVAKVKAAWGAIGTWWSKNVTDPIKTGFKNCLNGVIGFFEGVANKGIDAVNSIASALNSLHFTVPAWVPGFGGKSVGFSLAQHAHIALPRLASGAVLPGGSPYAAIVNDQPAGRTNIESPLSTIVDAMVSALQSFDFGASETNVNVQFSGQMAALARAMNPYIQTETVRKGGSAVERRYA